MLRHLLSIVIVGFAFGVAAQTDLVVEVKLKGNSTSGTIRVAVCPDAGSFASEQGCKLEEVKAAGPVALVKFTDIAPGQYGVKVYHDVDGNGKLDTGAMGIPKEPFGFGNDAMGTFGPPSFEDAKVTVAPGANRTRIKLKGR